MSDDRPIDDRIDAILEVMLAYARQEFWLKAPVSDLHDSVDALATGLNMMAEELDGAVASKRELEAAYRALQDTQAKLVHSGKLVAIGQLASGVAHEINNPASWALIALALLREKLGALRRMSADGSQSDADVRAALTRTLGETEPLLDDAAEGLDRIRAVTGDLRTFSRADNDETEPLSVNDVVRAACSLVRPTLQQRATVTLVLGDPPAVMGNRGRLGQVVTNLLVNAAQALEGFEAREGAVRIETTQEGGNALLAVEDSGPGVPAGLRERIFEPFFTTKPAGLGTGLGLSLVAEIVHRMGGSVRVREGRHLGGACFEVRLPEAGVVVAPARTAQRSVPALVGSPKLRVLFVDDEPKLLRTYALLFEGEHEVQTAHGGEEALALLEQDSRFDVVVCDLQMPGMDGLALYEQVQGRLPAIARRFVFSTGGSAHDRMKLSRWEGEVTVLEKPVPPALLRSTLTRVAREASAAARHALPVTAALSAGQRRS